MPAKSGWVVYLDRDRLAAARIARGIVEWSEDSPFAREQSAEAAGTIARLLEGLGHAGEPLLLALGSSDVVSTTMSLPSRKALKRTGVGFLVEPTLPWSVEEAVIDFELVASERVFVVAAQAAPLRNLIVALQDKGLVVASVSPLARLAVESHLETARSLAPRYVLLWGNGKGSIDLWLIDHDHAVLWRWLPQQLPALVLTLKQIALCETDDFVLVGRNLPDDCLESVVRAIGCETRAAPALDSEDPGVCGAQFAASVLKGRRESAIELCRDQLAPGDRQRSIRRELRVLYASMAILLVVVGLAAGAKAQRAEALRAECQTRQAELFQNLFPKETTPVAINLRLQSEVTRLKGLRGENTDLPDLTPYRGVLERLLKSLPDSLRFRLLEVRVENGRLYLVGHVRAHGDADRIADGLRAAGLEVASPNTHRLEREGVEFRISAHFAPPSKKPVRRAA